MGPNDTIRLLILNDSQQEAERLISMLHNAGRPNRAQYVTSEESLTKLLQEHAWDIMIAHEKTRNLPPANALKCIRRLNKDVPVILLSDNSEDTQSVIEGLKMGAADVVRLDEDQHLLLVITRELQNRAYRQEKRIADRRFRESERRAQSLLDSSRDAIAYVQDGLYLYANESFAELFGYADRDEIDCMPIMDMVVDDDQPRLKDFLKDFTLKGLEADNTRLEFRGVRHDGSSTPIALDVSHATYDDEPCIQFLAKASTAGVDAETAKQLEAMKWKDVITGLYNRGYMLQHLDNSIDNLADGTSLSLFYIDINDFAEAVQQVLGIAGTDKAVADLAGLLKSQVRKGETLARFGDNTFTLLTDNITAEKALERARHLYQLIEDHIVDVEGKTLQLTASIGLSLVNENSTNAATVVEQAIEATEKARANRDEEKPIQLYEPPVSEEEREEKNIRAEVQNALDNDRFRLLFQPIISLRGSEDEYYEVLLRLLNDKDEEISPSHFFAQASDMGVGTKIDRWVVLEAIKMLAEHRSRGNKTKLIVNINRDSLCDNGLVPWLGVAFKAAKLPTDAIVFQVTEVDVNNHLNAAKALANDLAKMGTKLSISNFGCGLNPFNALKHVAADMIKVDGSFTQDIQSKNESPEGLTQLLEQLHEQDKTTIVPFVENASVLSTLWQAGVHYIQGHYLQEPSTSMSYDFNMEG